MLKFFKIIVLITLSSLSVAHYQEYLTAYSNQLNKIFALSKSQSKIVFYSKNEHLCEIRDLSLIQTYGRFQLPSNLSEVLEIKWLHSNNIYMRGEKWAKIISTQNSSSYDLKTVLAVDLTKDLTINPQFSVSEISDLIGVLMDNNTLKVYRPTNESQINFMTQPLFFTIDYSDNQISYYDGQYIKTYNFNSRQEIIMATQNSNWTKIFRYQNSTNDFMILANSYKFSIFRAHANCYTASNNNIEHQSFKFDSIFGGYKIIEIAGSSLTIWENYRNICLSWNNQLIALNNQIISFDIGNQVIAAYTGDALHYIKFFDDPQPSPTHFSIFYIIIPLVVLIAIIGFIVFIIVKRKRRANQMRLIGPNSNGYNRMRNQDANVPPFYQNGQNYQQNYYQNYPQNPQNYPQNYYSPQNYPHQQHASPQTYSNSPIISSQRN